MDDKSHRTEEFDSRLLSEKQRRLFEKQNEIFNMAAFLIKQGKEGQAEAAKLLYRTQHASLKRHFIYKIGNPADADDLVSETIFKFISGTPTKSPSAYFWRIARNAIIDLFRRTKAKNGADAAEYNSFDHTTGGEQMPLEPNLGLEDTNSCHGGSIASQIEPPAFHEDHANVYEAEQFYTKVFQAFEQAHPEHSLTLKLVAEDKKIHEIANIFGSNENAAKSRVSKARSVFEKFLKDFGRKL